MVRINLINPKYLADQHLIAEYNETLMLLGHVKKFPSLHNIPSNYGLGKGHIAFFKNKLLYLKKRHELIKLEMLKRGFKPTKTINLEGFSQQHLQDWNPKKQDKTLIKKRILFKLMLKPSYYSYHGKKQTQNFWKTLVKKSK